ncbi:Regulator of sigma D [Sinobacterium norvegicum]|uniref:Regulator of sigma D n=1 Tax=Sinobacterium norvegicum TaxID=1641715 RepID=A0ABN8EHQ9_9GAMM|nr:sigma D regulator [Sinobacterium norvegicum]CAH0991861.1 Regulator of sigma D [Sinobacterium norvegicum]
MLEHCENKKERWGGVEAIIGNWISERSQLLVKYCDLSAIISALSEDASESKEVKQAATELDAFCQLLMDYICAGHFEVFDQLINEAEDFDDGGLEYAAKIYPGIEASTEHALSFNDLYDGCGGARLLSTELQTDLSALGENLSQRFDLEDQLLEKMHYQHQKTIA